MQNWSKRAAELSDILMAAIITDAGRNDIEADDAFARWVEITLELRRRHRFIYLIGNGASASMASHMAADLAKNGKINTGVFTDLSLVTAIANDMGYEEVFAEPVRRQVTAGDMLVAISSSGSSPNILRACSAAVEKSATVVTLSAMQESNRLRSMGMLNFYVAAGTYGLAETCHAYILHHWMDLICHENKSAN